MELRGTQVKGSNKVKLYFYSSLIHLINYFFVVNTAKRMLNDGVHDAEFLGLKF